MDSNLTVPQLGGETQCERQGGKEKGGNTEAHFQFSKS